MSQRILHTSLVLLLALAGCSLLPVSYAPQQVDNRYELSLPSFLNETRDLNEDAPLQAANAYWGLYLISYHTPWEEVHRKRPQAGLSQLYTFHTENLRLDLEEASLTPADSLQLGGLPALSGQLSGRFRGEAVHYRLTLIGGETYVYQLLCWYPPDRAEALAPVIDSVLYSFRELR